MDQEQEEMIEREEETDSVEADNADDEAVPGEEQDEETDSEEEQDEETDSEEEQDEETDFEEKADEKAISEETEEDLTELVENDVKEKIIITFYTIDDDGEYYRLGRREADDDGHVSFPNVLEVEGYVFDCWQTENFENIDEGEVFTENCSLYAVFSLEKEESDMPMSVAIQPRASSIGISSTNPQSGQENRYEYTGGETAWVVPADGYYDLYCYGAQGGRGDYSGASGSADSGLLGATIGRRYYLNKGTVLTVLAGSQPQQSTAGGFGEGSTNGNTESISDYGYSRKILKRRKNTDHNVGTIWQYRGFPDGLYGNYKMTICNNNGSHSGGSTGGGGGGSSKVLIDSSLLISAKGGTGGSASYVTLNNDGSGTTGGGSCSGTTSATSLTNATMQSNLDSSSSNSGNGYVIIKVVAIMPGLVLEADTTEWTNANITISAVVKSEGEGLPDEYLSWEQDEEGNDIWTNETEFVVSQNGTYTCKIRDTAGNISEDFIDITNIDKLPPKTELAADITDWTASDITLTIYGDDADENTEYGKSGLGAATYLWGVADGDGNIVWNMKETETMEILEEPEPVSDGEMAQISHQDSDTPEVLETPAETEQAEAWTSESSYTVSQNGIYACRAKDKAGNVTECTYTVSNIDRTAPEIDYDRTDKWYDGETDITWIGYDLQPDGSAGSGLAEEAYSFDGVSYTALNVQRIPGAGTYKIWIRDKVGNTAEYDVAIEYDKKPESKGDKQSDLPVIMSVIEPDNEERGGHTHPVVIPPLPESVKIKKLPAEAIWPMIIPTIEPDIVKKQKSPSKARTEEEEPKTDDTKIPENKMVLPYIVSGTVTAGSILYLFLFFVAPIARIYELGEGKYKMKARKLILPGKKVDLRDNFENTEENKLLVKLGWLYAQRNRGNKMTYIKPNGVEKTDIQSRTIIER